MRPPSLIYLSRLRTNHNAITFATLEFLNWCSIFFIIMREERQLPVERGRDIAMDFAIGGLACLATAVQ